MECCRLLGLHPALFLGTQALIHLYHTVSRLGQLISGSRWNSKQGLLDAYTEKRVLLQPTESPSEASTDEIAQS